MITLTPKTFALVEFDHDRIVALASEVAEKVGHDPDIDIVIEVDESVALIKTELRNVDPVEMFIEGGALEDQKPIRQLDDVRARVVIGRLLLMAADRRSADFGEIPDVADMSLAHRAAWNTYCIGRLARLGYRGQRQRRLYNFRNRHGFHDGADAAFDTLWDAEELTWAQILELSDAANQVAA